MVVLVYEPSTQENHDIKTSLILMDHTFRRRRQVHFCEFEASLIYMMSSRLARDTHWKPVSKRYKGGRGQISTHRGVRKIKIKGHGEHRYQSFEYTFICQMQLKCQAKLGLCALTRWSIQEVTSDLRKNNTSGNEGGKIESNISSLRSEWKMDRLCPEHSFSRLDKKVGKLDEKWIGGSHKFFF